MLRCGYCKKESDQLEVVYYLSGGVDYACPDCIKDLKNQIECNSKGTYFRRL